LVGKNFFFSPPTSHTLQSSFCQESPQLELACKFFQNAICQAPFLSDDCECPSFPPDCQQPWMIPACLPFAFLPPPLSVQTYRLFFFLCHRVGVTLTIFLLLTRCTLLLASFRVKPLDCSIVFLDSAILLVSARPPETPRGLPRVVGLSPTHPTPKENPHPNP